MYSLHSAVMFADVGLLMQAFVARNAKARKYLLTCGILTQENIDFPEQNIGEVLALTKLGILAPAFVREALEQSESSSTELDEVLAQQSVEYPQHRLESSKLGPDVHTNSSTIENFKGDMDIPVVPGNSTISTLTSTVLVELDLSQPKLEFGSPLTRTILMQLLRPTSCVSEWLFEEWLDYITLVVPLMNVSAVCGSMSTKRVGGQFVPSEHAFHYEFHRVLNLLVPAQNQVSSQVGGAEYDMGNLRLDITINTTKKIGLELTANTTADDNLGHLLRFESGYKSLELQLQVLALLVMVSQNSCF